MNHTLSLSKDEARLLIRVTIKALKGSTERVEASGSAIERLEAKVLGLYQEIFSNPIEAVEALQ